MSRGRVKCISSMLHEVSNRTWTEKLVKRVFKDERVLGNNG